MILVTLVVFIFLQSWRATLIPMLAVPVAIIGTFLGLRVLGFSINVLTLFGLVLAIGIVVDDAIVVIENVERIMARGARVARAVAADQRDAAGGRARSSRSCSCSARCSCRSRSSAASPARCTSSSPSRSSISVVLSGIVALTLTPALCALLLTTRADSAPNRVLRLVQPRFDGVTQPLRPRASNAMLGTPAAVVGGVRW